MERKAYNASSLFVCESGHSGSHSVSFGVRFGKLDLMSRSVRRVVVRSRSFVRSKSREAYATRVQECESIRPRSDDEQEKEDSYSECSYSTTDVEHRRSSLRLSSSYPRVYIGTSNYRRTFGNHHGIRKMQVTRRGEDKRNLENEMESSRKSSNS